MQTTLVLQNLLSAPVLFFFLGILAVVLGSDLEIPSPLPKLFSLYLLLAIGFKGGVELSHSGLGPMVLHTIGAAILMSLLVPIGSFIVLRARLGPENAAAVAAAYGSISAVTFITAQSFLNVLKLPFDGFMVAALALMESPAIVVGVVMAKLAASQLEKERGGPMPEAIPWGEVLREAFLNGSVFLLIGSLVIGALVAHFSPTGVER
ncbi:MAG: sodium-dependent bicarbonate transport family permease, partial [Cyanobium sp.]